MDALTPIVRLFDTLIAVLRPTVFTVAVVTAAAATASWAVRTRRIGPFTSFARLTRKSIDPLFLPAERRVTRLGGMPAQAAWWTVGAVVIGGLILLAMLEFLREQLMLLAATTYGGPRSILLLIVNWAFMVLKVAIIARVISSWVGGNRYSRWWGWSYRLTEWFLAPLRRILPSFGPLDLSPLVAYFGISLLQSLIQGSL
jgi:YggT family protein